MKVKKSTFKSAIVLVLAMVLIINTMVPMTVLGASGATGNYYTVKSGDTLSKIASSYGVTVDSIVALNNISASSTIYSGQVLVMPSGSSYDGGIANTSSYGTLSLSFKETPVRDIVSAILSGSGLTAIYVGDDTSLTVELKNMDMLTALDYVLRLSDMTYVKSGNTVFVGASSKLSGSFIDRVTLARFTLRYITADLLRSRLATLGVSTEFIQGIDTMQNRVFWVDATPMELTTIREMIELLDNENNLEIGGDALADYLTAIDVQYISAATLSSLLSQLGMHAGITLADYPKKLFVYATGDALDDIYKIKALIDTPDALSAQTGTGTGDGTGDGTGGGTGSGDITITDGEKVLKKLTLNCIEKADVEAIVGEFALNVEILGLDIVAKTVWLLGTNDDVTNAVSVISSFDIDSLKKSNTFFTYELQNITAAELQSRLGYIDLQGVQFYWGLYPNVSHSVTIFCPADQRDSVVDILDNLDTTSTKLYMPIASATDATGVETLKLKVGLLTEMLGIDESNFYFSGDIDASESYKYILYVYESPENIQLIKEMMSQISGV